VECSAQYALRSWLYIILHKVVAAPAAWWFGAAAGKVAVFTATRAVLGMTSAVTEAMLFRYAARVLTL
jgi:alpha-1,2-mannosyltransferase